MNTYSQWLSFNVNGQLLAFELEYIREMLQVPDLHSVPGAALDSMGVVLIRNRVIPVFDIRLTLGYPPQGSDLEELIQMLAERRKDHENWVNELERSVAERRPFTLTTDPHKCKFGIWYDAYNPPNGLVAHILRRMDAPHKAIHATGTEIKSLVERKEFDKALEVIKAARQGQLHEIIGFFEELATLLRKSARPCLVIVGTESRRIGIVVDSIDSVAKFDDEQVESPDSIPGHQRLPGLVGVGRERNTQKMALLLDPIQLFPQLIATTETLSSPAHL